MKAIEKHFVQMAIIYLICLITEITGSALPKPIIQKHNNRFIRRDFNQAWEKDIQQPINTTADPCNDFYEYSCGNYGGYNNSDEYAGEITQYLDQKFNTKLMHLIKPRDCVDAQCFNISNDKRKQTFWGKTQNYYRACCVRENQKNFMKYFEELQIKWPLLLKENETYTFRNIHFWKILGELQSYNWNNLIIKHQITVSKNDILSIVLEPTINNESILPEDVAIKGFLSFLNVNNKSEVVQQLKDTEEKWLEKLQNNANSNETYIEISLVDLTVQYPFLRYYLRSLFSRTITKINKILLKNVGFFNDLQRTEWTTNELQQQLNYLMVNFLFYLFKDSSTEFNEKACVNDLRNKFDLAVNYIYYEKIYSKDYWLFEDSLSRINNQLQNTIQEVFVENNLNLSLQQVRDLKDKLHQIKVNLGNLPYPVSSETIEIFYHEVPDLDNRNYFKNHLLMLKHRFRKSLLYQEDLNFFISFDNNVASSSSMLYVTKQNLVVIPFASLQYPFYDYSYKPIYKMSLMGFSMAHEMGHAFDINGLTATGHSSILQHDLYLKSLECMQTQEPTKDIEERIADLLAERVVYRTYEKYYNAGNTANWQRQFYLSMAQFFCCKGNLKFVDHDPSNVRLHQIVKNSVQFAKAFNCPLNSPMNPQQKCRLY